MKKTITALFFLTILNFHPSFGESNLSIVDYSQTGLMLIKGSALCQDLSLSFYLPDSLKYGYSYESESAVNLDTKTIDITYTLNSLITNTLEPSEVTERIVTSINNHFSSLDPIDYGNDWTLSHSFIINNEQSESFTTSFQPYNTCVQITNDCDRIVAERKEFINETSCGSLNGTFYNFYISNDSIILEKFNTPVIDICIEYDTHIRTQEYEITEFETLNYKVYNKITSSYTFPLDISLDNVTTNDIGNIIANPALNVSYVYLKNIDLTACIIDGVNKTISSELNIYPNPATKNLSIDNYNEDLTLYNQFGQQYTIQGNGTYSVEHLPKGIYIISIEKDGEALKENIIIL